MTIEQLQRKENKLWRQLQAITQDDNLLDIVQELIEVNIVQELIEVNIKQSVTCKKKTYTHKTKHASTQ